MGCPRRFYGAFVSCHGLWEAAIIEQCDSIPIVLPSVGGETGLAHGTSVQWAIESNPRSGSINFDNRSKHVRNIRRFSRRRIDTGRLKFAVASVYYIQILKSYYIHKAFGC